VRLIFNFLRPLHPTPFTCGWMWVPSSGRSIRLCDRFRRGHQHDIFGLHPALYLSYKISNMFRPVYTGVLVSP